MTCSLSHHDDWFSLEYVAVGLSQCLCRHSLTREPNKRLTLHPTCLHQLNVEPNNYYDCDGRQSLRLLVQMSPSHMLVSFSADQLTYRP